ncbi:uncharacterized protein TRAVEDRAFT_102597, partial [Trametes versicolor FP-101664 SS1]|uniref:uncharacterized protein n=1 Tax=Trametes versicolor (strain FP-101664) TaxID=717944 RepID=UPI0004623C6A
LRAHIRSLLSQYAATHLATNYIAWTESEVANGLAECLGPIPMTERNAIALPLEPLQVLSQQLNLISLDVYEERWKVIDKDAVAYLK